MTRWEKTLISCALVITGAIGVCTWLLLDAIHAEARGVMFTIERH